MAISDKTRKRLWAKSGNRCAISKIELVHEPDGDCDETIIGEECHICAKSPGGPRYDKSLSESEIDDYDNLILLSRNYHKIIDENPAYYSVERLKNIKKTHEEWVRQVLNFGIRNIQSKKYPETTISYLQRIMTGNQLINIITGCHAYDFDNDELKDEYEVNLIGSFLQEVQDWGDLISEMESGEQVRAKYNLGHRLKELEENGFWVFGTIISRKVRIGENIDTWNISVIRVLRTDNPEIISLGFDSNNST